MIDMSNIAEVTHLAVKFNMLKTLTTGLSAVERSNTRQALGIEIEERALELVAEVRRARGYGDDFDADDASALVPEEAVEQPEETEETPPALDGPFNGAKVRDFMVLYGDGFIIPELHAAVGGSLKEVKEYVDIWARNGHLERTNFKLGRHWQYRYIPPTATVKVKPTAPPPERATPGVGAERRANGQAVGRGRLARASKQSRSLPGVRHRLEQSEAQAQRVREAQERRAAAQRRKK